MIISSSFSGLLFHWRCFSVSLFRQCSIVVLCCSVVFRLFWRCSIVPALFRCSSGVPLFQRCFVVPQVFRRSVFRCSWLYSMPIPWGKAKGYGTPLGALFSFVRLFMKFNTFFAFIELSFLKIITSYSVSIIRLLRIPRKTLTRPLFKAYAS